MVLVRGCTPELWGLFFRGPSELHGPIESQELDCGETLPKQGVEVNCFLSHPQTEQQVQDERGVLQCNGMTSDKT